jgi:hypothetical protein
LYNVLTSALQLLGVFVFYQTCQRSQDITVQSAYNLYDSLYSRANFHMPYKADNSSKVVHTEALSAAEGSERWHVANDFTGMGQFVKDLDNMHEVAVAWTAAYVLAGQFKGSSVGCSVACLLACLVGWSIFSQLLTQLLALLSFLLACLLACMLACLLACLLTCLLVCLLACLLAWSVGQSLACSFHCSIV